MFMINFNRQRSDPFRVNDQKCFNTYDNLQQTCTPQQNKRRYLIISKLSI